MKIVKKVLKELRNADVTHVSLVDRSASRIPFRITKRDSKEQEMLDLTNPGKLFGRAAKTDKKPDAVVAAVVVMGQSDEDMVGVVKALNDAGFATDKATKNDDGTIMYAQVDEPMKDAHVIKMSDELLVVMKGFDTYSQDMRENGDFNDQMAAAGFFPGLNTAFDALYNQVSNCLYQCASPEEAASSIKSSLSKFSAYVAAMAAALPAKAFKADTAILELVAKKDKPMKAAKPAEGSAEEEAGESKATEAAEGTDDNEMNGKKKKAMKNIEEGLPLEDAEKADMKMPDGVDSNEWDKMTLEAKKAMIAKASAKPAMKEEEAPADLETELTSKADGTCWAGYERVPGTTAGAKGSCRPVKKADETPAVKAEDEPNGFTKMFEGIQGTLQAIADQMKAHGEQISTLAAKVDGQQNNVDEAVRKSDDAIKVLKSAVVVPADQTDLPAPTTLDGITKKSDENADPRSGFFDTGLLSRTQIERIRKSQGK